MSIFDTNKVCYGVYHTYDAGQDSLGIYDNAKIYLNKEKAQRFCDEQNKPIDLDVCRAYAEKRGYSVSSDEKFLAYCKNKIWDFYYIEEMELFD